MNIIKYPNIECVDNAVKDNEPLMAVISFDNIVAYLSPIDEAVEHHVLLSNLGLSSLDIDKYFRIIFDKDSADWTFICPPNYKNIHDKRRRIAEFYKDGFASIRSFLTSMNYNAAINIPKRYARHFTELKD